MKKLKIVMLPFALLFIIGCHDYKKDAEILQEQNNMLTEAAVHRDSTINSFLMTLNEIEENLGTITNKQAAISKTTESGMELKTTQVDRIRENISSINELLEINKDKIAALTKKLKNANFKTSGLEKMLASLNSQLEEKNVQLNGLNDQLANMQIKVETLNTDISTLTAENTEKQIKIEDQTKKMHQAYYVTGTSKELIEQNVIVKSGGFLGLGKEEKLMGDINRSAFQAIDVTETNTIPIHAKDVELLTSHPSDSYTIQHEGAEVSQIIIKDPDKFWLGSRYLVVMLDK